MQELDKKEFQEKIKQVVSALDYSWDPRNAEYAWNAAIANDKDGHSLFFQGGHGSQCRKLTVSVNYPKNKEGRTLSYGREVRASLSFDKTVEQIASDIKRRIFPRYYEFFKQVLGDIATSNNMFDHKESVKAAICLKLGIESSDNARHADTFYPYGAKFYIDKVEVRSGDTVIITTDPLEESKALALIDLLKKE